MSQCLHCQGQGWIEDVEPGCCGRPTEHGDCCGQPIPVQCQIQCEGCLGTGEVPDDPVAEQHFRDHPHG